MFDNLPVAAYRRLPLVPRMQNTLTFFKAIWRNTYWRISAVFLLLGFAALLLNVFDVFRGVERSAPRHAVDPLPAVIHGFEARL